MQKVDFYSAMQSHLCNYWNHNNCNSSPKCSNTENSIDTYKNFHDTWAGQITKELQNIWAGHVTDVWEIMQLLWSTYEYKNLWLEKYILPGSTKMPLHIFPSCSYSIPKRLSHTWLRYQYNMASQWYHS